MRTLLAAAVLVATPAASATPLRVLEPTTTLSAADKIGTLKEGLLCLPKRALRLSDLGPTRGNAQDVAAVFASSGVAVATGDRSPGALPDAGPSLSATLTITITEVDATVCVPAYGIGHARKGRGSVTTLWRLFGADRRELFARSYQTDFTIRGRDSADGIGDAIVAAARQVAKATLPLLQ